MPDRERTGKAQRDLTRSAKSWNDAALKRYTPRP